MKWKRNALLLPPKGSQCEAAQAGVQLLRAVCQNVCNNLQPVLLATVGWLGCPDKLGTAIKKRQGRVRMANKWMRVLIFGGSSHLDIIAASNLFRVVGDCVSRDCHVGMPRQELRSQHSANGSGNEGSRNSGRGIGPRKEDRALSSAQAEGASSAGTDLSR